jgi:hypothetical protein
MMAVRTSETSVSFNVTTRRHIPEDSKLDTRRRENLKSHIELWYLGSDGSANPYAVILGYDAVWTL